MKLTLAFCVLLLLVIAGTVDVRGQAPPLMNYQGQLQDSTGAPLATADYVLTFSLWDAVNGGTRVWGPQIYDGQTAPGHGLRIPVVQGYFNAMLGPVDTSGNSLAGAFEQTGRFIEIKVGDNAPISPRQQILSAPFAFKAQTAENAVKLGGFDWGNLLQGGTNNPQSTRLSEAKLPVGVTIPVGGIIMWWGRADNLPAGFELCDGTSPSTLGALLAGTKPNFTDRFPKGPASGTSDVVAAFGQGGTNSVPERKTGGTAITLNQMARHDHGGATGTGSVSGTNPYRDSGTINNLFAQKLINYTDTTRFRNRFSDHTHSIQAQGNNEAHDHSIPQHDNRPAFMEVFFIIRVK